ncbi:MAG: FMN-binding protein [Spirochaetaceae bacterium]|jgi:major membrane immunogen (membrane-anchored lipoprotein)|nr:FMN-binding protein [Spirochaetaceae bacterium]
MNTRRGFLLPVLALVLFACGSPRYADGVFTGRSGADDTGAYGDVTLTIQNGSVAACRFVTVQKDGTIKDEDYGKVNGEISNADYYAKAQLAVRAMKSYEEQYLRSGSLDQVDAVSGATIAYNQFTEAVENALGAARK